MKYKSVIFFIIYFIFNQSYSQTVTTESLLDELTDLNRLAEISNPSYNVLHFTSYDRRSKGKASDEEGWFMNSDGFGKEPVPNFEDVIDEPGIDGIGRYLICEVEGPGAIVRTWSARIKGEVAVYLDNNEVPLYKGPAEPFFVNTYFAVLGQDSSKFDEVFTQFLSGYYPIPFAKKCRIEWIGDIKTPHFYYVQLRKYESSSRVETFTLANLRNNENRIGAIRTLLDHPANDLQIKPEIRDSFSTVVKPINNCTVFKLDGAYSICELVIKLTSNDIQRALRQNILRISFDNRHWGQVQAPIGDFFCSDPGINPAGSLPFTVTETGEMTCRFVMPFKDSCKIIIDNYSGQECIIEGKVAYSPYEWTEGKSMYFNAKWRTDNNITATNNPPKDMVFLMANGTGRFVGTCVFLLNPSTAPSRNGSWWGEGDEKIFIDNNKFPAVFGTGSEDYFGYAWGAEKLFSHAFIGQPRNDGPGNRGFVINYRFHIIDDFPFFNNLDFFMELFHQDSVPGFSFGRIVYYYALPGSFDDHQVISENDLQLLKLPDCFHLKAFKGSKNFIFYEAESILKNNRNVFVENGSLWSENSLMIWIPEKVGEELKFDIPIEKAGKKMRVMLTMRGSPEDGKILTYLNNNRIGDAISLNEDFHVLSKNIQLEDAIINKDNELVLVFDGIPGQQVGIDFIWVRID